MKKKMFKFISCITILFMVSCSGDDLLFSYEDDVTTRGLSGRASLTYPMSSFISNGVVEFNRPRFCQFHS